MKGESREQREARLQDLWSKLDTKQKGTLDFAALKNGLVKIDHPLKDADAMIRQMLVACDIDHDGKITYEEFSRFCKQTEEELWALFQSIDKDDDGKLDRKELAQAFDKAGVAVSNARIDRFFQYIDKNHDGTIDFDEWRDFLLFIPANAPGLKAVFSYYTTTVKLSAEGDVFLSDEALQGLGTIINLLKRSLFGALLPLAQPPARSPQLDSAPQTTQSAPIASAAAPAELTGVQADDDVGEVVTVAGGEEPYVLVEPVLQEEGPQQQLRLTDFVPNAGYFIAGGISGICSRTATAPLDRLKVYLIAQTGSAEDVVRAAKSGNAIQAAKHGFASLANACRELWAAGGIRSLFAGNGLNVIKVMPESAVKFGSYEASKRAVARLEGHNDPRRISSWSQFTAGGLAGMIAQFAVYPLDTLKFRMQCETVPGGEHGNKLILHTMQKMWKTNGVAGFYRGLPMGLVGMFPYAAIDLFMFETLKKKIIKRNMELKGLKHEEDALPGNFAMAIMGGFSGAIGATVVYPLNLLRTRLQSQGTASHPRTYTGIVDVTRQTIKGEGFRGLFKGLTPNLLKVVPAVSITYVVYEDTKRALKLH